MNIGSDLALRSGNTMPCMGLGTWKLMRNTAETISAALEQGYRMIDTSGDYGTQPGIGDGIRRADIDRDSFYLVTKIEDTDDDAYEAVQKNLEELQLSYANLILIHRPPEGKVGTELWEGLIRAKRDGLTRDIGVSNYAASLLQSLIDATDETPVVNQIEWSPFGHSEEMLAFCKERNIVVQAYSPLTRATRLDDGDIVQVADRYQKTPAQIMLRWNLQLGTVPLPKANEREHQRENIDVFDFNLSDEDMNRLSSLNQRYSALGELPYS